jgi:hypothetical protein
MLCRRRLHGTTLTAPCAWAAFAFFALACAEFAAAWAAGVAWLPHARFLAAGATFCPLMALLGAKRPQDRGWQFVVVSLWGLVVFYGLTELAYWPHRTPTLHWVVRWLLVVPLMAMGLLNYLPTRYWLPAILAAIGQALLLSPQLPEVQRWLPAIFTDAANPGAIAALTGIVSLAAALAVVILFARRRTVGILFDRAWLDFRDHFGTFWALRVAARFNQSAEQLGWNGRLAWHGLVPTDTANPRASERADDDSSSQRQVMQSLLRRFVNDKWLARQWGEDLAAASPHGKVTGAAGSAECAGTAPGPPSQPWPN